MGKYPDLKGKRVVITGGASGIGFATVERFIDEGAKVVIFDISEDALADAQKSLPEIVGGIKVDVADEKGVADAFLEMDKLLGGIDILISNAGISVRNLFMDTDYAQWQRVMDINLGGMYLCSKEAIKRMEKQQSGVVLFTASNNGMEGRPYYVDYNASKAGVISLTKTLALECAPWLRVNSICPGYVMTPMQQAEYTQEAIDKLNEAIPLGRHAQPSEVAALFAFLASDDAQYITGTFIPIDGGETA
jgi:meso-butanediol dehydrogenase / (S,S)-butanediol dehydrogenase / diacetyl reductase